MDKDIKAKWVAELRSNQHGKAFGALMEKPYAASSQLAPLGKTLDDVDMCHCALGLLIRVMDEPRHGGFPTMEELQEAGLTDDQSRKIMSMSDQTLTYNFDEIADYVERNF